MWLFFDNGAIIPSLTVEKQKTVVKPVKSMLAAVFCFVAICAIVLYFLHYGKFIWLFRGNGGLKTAATPVVIHAKRHSVLDLEVECVYQSIQGTPYRAYFVCF